MAKTTYNASELLDKKKAIEKELVEKSKINQDDLVYEEQNSIDYNNDKNSKKFVPRDKVSFETYISEVSTLCSELAKVKTALAKHNVEQVKGLMNQREAARIKRAYFDGLKNKLRGIKKSFDRRTIRENDDDEAIEVMETTKEPMFDLKIAEKMYNDVSAEERKLNTEIQKINLNAKITLD